MKPATRHLKPKRSNKMSNEVETKKEEVQQLPKWRLWVKDNKVKLLAVIGVALSAIGGDAVGIIDFVSAWFF